MRQVRAEIHFTVNVDEEDGCFWAEIVEIPGCFVWGRSMAEVREALVEAVHATVHSVDARVVLRDLEPVTGEGADAAPSSSRGPSRRHVSARVVEHPVLSQVPGGPDGSGHGPDSDDERPLAELVSLAGRRASRD